MSVSQYSAATFGGSSEMSTEKVLAWGGPVPPRLDSWSLDGRAWGDLSEAGCCGHGMEQLGLPTDLCECLNIWFYSTCFWICFTLLVGNGKQSLGLFCLYVFLTCLWFQVTVDSVTVLTSWWFCCSCPPWLVCSSFWMFKFQKTLITCYVSLRE